MGKVLYVLVSVVRHLLQWANKLVGKHILINELFVFKDYFRDAELDIWNVILGSLNEDWNYVLSDGIFRSVWHHSSQRVEAAHSVVVSLLVNSVMVVHNWDVFLKNPILREASSQNTALLDTHLPYTGCSVGQISHESCLEMLLEKIFSKDDS